MLNRQISPFRLSSGQETHNWIFVPRLAVLVLSPRFPYTPLGDGHLLSHVAENTVIMDNDSGQQYMLSTRPANICWICSCHRGGMWQLYLAVQHSTLLVVETFWWILTEQKVMRVGMGGTCLSPRRSWDGSLLRSLVKIQLHIVICFTVLKTNGILQITVLNHRLFYRGKNGLIACALCCFHDKN